MMKCLGKKVTIREELLVRALTDMRLNLNYGINKTSLRINCELNLTSPHKLTGILTLFGKVTLELVIGFKDRKELTSKQICFDAPGSII